MFRAVPRNEQRPLFMDCAEEGEIVHGLFCQATEVKRQRFEYVGEGAGAYNPRQVYNYVGEGVGSYDKQAKSGCCSGCSGCSPPTCCCTRTWICTAISGLVLAVAMVLVLGYIYFGDLSFIGLDVCVPMNDCIASYAESSSLIGCQQKWCCREQGVGCPWDDSVVPKSSVGRLVGPVRGCSTICKLEGKQRTCGERIKSITNLPKSRGGLGEKCDAAYQQASIIHRESLRPFFNVFAISLGDIRGTHLDDLEVTAQCSFCHSGVCSLKEAGCL